MPRKTIASLEEVIATQQALLEQQARELGEARQALNEKRFVPPNTYLTYQATGNDELDAVQVAWRALDTLLPQARRRSLAWLYDALCPLDPTTG